MSLQRTQVLRMFKSCNVNCRYNGPRYSGCLNLVCLLLLQRTQVLRMFKSCNVNCRYKGPRYSGCLNLVMLTVVTTDPGTQDV